MNWQEYQKQSPRTLPSFFETYNFNELAHPSVILPAGVLLNLKTFSFRTDLAHCTLGIVSEVEELFTAIYETKDQVNIKEELVDMLWYVSGIIHLYKSQGVELEKSSNYEFKFNNDIANIRNLVDSISKFSDIPKKTLAYKRHYPSSEIDEALYNVLDQINSQINEYGIDISNGLDTNIAKLKERFKEKFTEDQAINRDLDAERVQLEK